jgi:hypothetical protein
VPCGALTRKGSRRGEPREVVVSVAAPLILRCVVLGLLTGGVTLELADGGPLFEGFDVRY